MEAHGRPDHSFQVVVRAEPVVWRAILAGGGARRLVAGATRRRHARLRATVPLVTVHEDVFAGVVEYREAGGLQVVERRRVIQPGQAYDLA